MILMVRKSDVSTVDLQKCTSLSAARTDLDTGFSMQATTPSVDLFVETIQNSYKSAIVQTLLIFIILAEWSVLDS